MGREHLRQRLRTLGVSHLAAGLVLALVAHLALMASPLHAMAMSPDGGAAAPAAVELHGAMPAPQSLSCMGSAADCTAEWTAPASSWSIQSVMSAAPALGTG